MRQRIENEIRLLREKEVHIEKEEILSLHDIVRPLAEEAGKTHAEVAVSVLRLCSFSLSSL